MPDPIREMSNTANLAPPAPPFDWISFLEQMVIGRPYELENESARVYFRRTARRLGFIVTTSKTNDGRLVAWLIER